MISLALPYNTDERPGSPTTYSSLECERINVNDTLTFGIYREHFQH